MISTRYPPRVATTGPPPRSPTSGSSRTVMPAKQKILSILDRARNAMEESYGGYEEPIYEAPPPAAHYDAYYPPVAPTSRSSRYEVQDYEPTEYRRDYYHREATAYPGKSKYISLMICFCGFFSVVGHFQVVSNI